MIKVALVGTPNVGKSTIYNALTKNHEHTGNWAGKTVEFAKGLMEYQGTTYEFYDLPGTYSLISKSKEEMVATDFIFQNNFDVAVVVCDATSLQKGLNLVIQTREICQKVVVVINLIDEAKKKGITIDAEKLSRNLGCEVVLTSAKEKMGLNDLLIKIKNCQAREYLNINYGVLEPSLNLVMKDLKETHQNKKWIAMRILENNEHYLEIFENENLIKGKDNIKKAKELLNNVDVSLEIVIKIMHEVKINIEGVIFYHKENKKVRRMDKILTSKIWGIPLMLLFLLGLFYITIVGANYPSNLLFSFFESLEVGLLKVFQILHFPTFLTDLLVNGVYKTLYWVVSVMMPPMLIFFPLFSFLEDLGVLPRIAFNMDRAFSKCEACGKQALTMCMGIGCNAVGVTGARIIDTKRERLIAILTNVFMPCNGKFPTLIAISTMFIVGLNKSYSNLVCALILTGFIALGIFLTFLISYILAKTILKGTKASFTLELPPYRVPKIIPTIVNSVKNEACHVLGRAVKVSALLGIVIWLVANIKINNILLLDYIINFLNPIGKFLGLDGIIILALLLGFPANEIVVPAMLMCYLRTSSLTDFASLEEFKNILIMNGWNLKMAISFLMLMIYHYPCSTTLLTIKKETNSTFYTLLSFLIPTLVGIILCLLIKII